MNKMNTCQEYEDLHPNWKEQIEGLIRKMKGKSNIADVTIAKSELKCYKFKVTVCKFNSVKEWVTIGYLRNDIFRGGIWRLTYKPRLIKGETLDEKTQDEVNLTTKKKGGFYPPPCKISSFIKRRRPKKQ